MNKALFQTVEGAKVTDLTDLYESYSLDNYNLYHVFKINISAVHMKEMIIKLSSLVRSPIFLTLEIPTSDDEEKELREQETDPVHNDIYYLEDLSQEKFLELFNQYEELLINDGFINFGISSSDGIDELLVKEYKIFYIMTDEPDKYEKILNEYNFKKEKKIKTVWDTFTKETPGTLSSIEANGKDMYDLVEELKKEGLYLAHREER